MQIGLNYIEQEIKNNWKILLLKNPYQVPYFFISEHGRKGRLITLCSIEDTFTPPKVSDEIKRKFKAVADYAASVPMAEDLEVYGAIIQEKISEEFKAVNPHTMPVILE
jgi:hypothetical protein